jgi:hypothetical protein
MILGRAVVLVTLLQTLCVGPHGSAQEPGLPLSDTVLPADWGVPDLARVRSGRLGVLEEAAGPRVVVYSLHLGDTQKTVYPAAGQVPAFQGNSLVVADFSRGNRNALGGYFNSFEAPPSRGTATLAPAGDGRRALRLSCEVRQRGFCGLWVHLFDFRAHPRDRAYLDARSFSVLTFWIRGEKGGERLLIKLADAQWEEREDALAIGEVGEFVSSGRIEPGWQRAEIPLHRIPQRVSLETLASIVFQAVSPGPSRVYLTRLALSVDPGGLPELPEAEANRPLATGGGEERHLATWVWNTAELLEDPRRAERLVQLLRTAGFDRIFLQLPDHGMGGSLPGEVAFSSSRLRPLLRLFAEAGIQTFALDGAPWFALAEYHEGVLRTVQRVIDYNRESDEVERFVGVRYDIEPYLLAGFNGPRRASILVDFLRLTKRMAELAAGGGLALGLDIPFWYDAPDERTYEAVTVDFGGRRMPASHHLIDLADEVAIMDYRTSAYGADGTITHAESELAYAAERGKKVYVGLETSPLPDEVLVDFGGEPKRGLPIAGDGGSLVAFVEWDDSALAFFLPGGARGGNPASGIGPLFDWVSRLGLRTDGILWWPVQRTTTVPARKLTFHDLGLSRLSEVMERTDFEFQRYPSFLGFALHHADSYARLLAESAGSKARTPSDSTRFRRQGEGARR